MPEYKKRRGGRLKNPPRTVRKKQSREKKTDDIAMTSSAKKQPSQDSMGNMRVVKGKKLEQQRRAKTFAAAVTVIFVIVLVFHFVLPGGIVANVENITATIGSGGYPIELDSTDTIHAVSIGHTYYVLTNTRLYAFANNGKKILSEAHGFEDPVLKTSKTRALLFSQSGTVAELYNLQGKKLSVETEENIVAAAVSDTGAFALVTRADTYASAVLVYDKKGNLLYEWDSATDTVNSVEIAPNGKKIAVSTFNASSGKYTSEICILNLDSVTPAWSETVTEGLVYELNASGGGFYAVSQNRVRFIHWSKGKLADVENEYRMNFFRENGGSAVAVFTRASDKTDNRIVLLSSKGAVKSSFEWKGEISDIQVANGHIYCMSDTTVMLFGNDGEVLRSASCSFGAVRLSTLGTDLVAVISDRQIEKINLE